MDEVENIHQDGEVSHHEEDAIEKLKNAEWVSPPDQNESYENQNYSSKNRQRNVVHQNKGDSIHSGLTRNQRSVSQKAKKRNPQK
jgi:hypothetical protein